MSEYSNTPGPAAAPTPPPPRRSWPMKLSLLGVGVAAGAVLAGGMVANAATSTPAPPAGSSTAAPATGTALSMSGTITAVGASSVDIRDAAGTVTTYQVSSASDIDKSGESTLADLTVGDAVTFSATNGTIDKLHTGTESQNHSGVKDPTDSTTPTA